ncbi:hypothetical protein [uncultured Pseudomonas sp.]|uniref:hypothetical protein n=1 Tax=uncultured Pseudomonas sp. TaxID=114707 RepID=UPI0025DF40FE|nr:hypothetical protein [uncultured Pseudomonas sp.]
MLDPPHTQCALCIQAPLLFSSIGCRCRLGLQGSLRIIAARPRRCSSTQLPQRRQGLRDATPVVGLSLAALLGGQVPFGHHQAIFVPQFHQLPLGLLDLANTQVGLRRAQPLVRLPSAKRALQLFAKALLLGDQVTGINARGLQLAATSGQLLLGRALGAFQAAQLINGIAVLRRKLFARLGSARQFITQLAHSIACRAGLTLSTFQAAFQFTEGVHLLQRLGQLVH